MSGMETFALVWIQLQKSRLYIILWHSDYLQKAKPLQFNNWYKKGYFRDFCFDSNRLFFPPVASLPYLYHCFTSLRDHLTLISSLPPALNRLFLNLLSSVLYFKGMQQLIWAEVIDVKGVTILLTFFPYWFSYPALPVWLKLKCSLLWRTENYETWKYH